MPYRVLTVLKKRRGGGDDVWTGADAIEHLATFEPHEAALRYATQNATTAVYGGFDTRLSL